MGKSLTMLGMVRCWAVTCIISSVSVLSFHQPLNPLLLGAKKGPPNVRPLFPRLNRLPMNTLRMSSSSAAGRIGSFGEFDKSHFVDLSTSETKALKKPGQLNTHPTKRQRRKKRAPPSELQQWLTKLGTLPGGLKMLLDLDNNADAVMQLEEADVASMLKECEVRGFAGQDYCGPEPGWLPIHRCSIRTKNGADFVLAFWAGRLVEAALSEWDAARGQRDGAQAARGEAGLPMIIIVSADAGMEVVASEVRSQGMEAHVVKNVGELGTLLKALGAIEHIGPGLCYVKPPLSGLDL